VTRYCVILRPKRSSLIPASAFVAGAAPSRRSGGPWIAKSLSALSPVLMRSCRAPAETMIAPSLLILVRLPSIQTSPPALLAPEDLVVVRVDFLVDRLARPDRHQRQSQMFAGVEDAPKIRIPPSQLDDVFDKTLHGAPLSENSAPLQCAVWGSRPMGDINGRGRIDDGDS